MAGGDKREDLIVFIQHRTSSTCGECGRELFKGNFIRLQREKGVLCLECADLDHLEFLPRGDDGNHAEINKILETLGRRGSVVTRPQAE